MNNNSLIKQGDRMGIDRETDRAGMQAESKSLLPDGLTTGKHSGLKLGREASGTVGEGTLYSGVGFSGNYRAVGVAVGYSVNKLPEGVGAGVRLSATYNLVSRATEVKADASVHYKSDPNITLPYQGALSVTYNDKSGYSASVSGKVTYNNGTSMGPFNDVKPYAAAAISTDPSASHLTVGVTGTTSIGSADLKLNIGARMERDGPKAIVGVRLSF